MEGSVPPIRAGIIGLGTRGLYSIARIMAERSAETGFCTIRT